MKKIFVLILIVPSLCWGLTFKSDGTVVDKQAATLTQIQKNNLEPKRTPNGGLVPVIGTPLQTPYGTARVVGYDDGNIKVEITDYNEDVTNVDNKVAELAKARNRGLQC